MPPKEPAFGKSLFEIPNDGIATDDEVRYPMGGLEESSDTNTYGISDEYGPRVSALEDTYSLRVRTSKPRFVLKGAVSDALLSSTVDEAPYYKKPRPNVYSLFPEAGAVHHLMSDVEQRTRARLAMEEAERQTTESELESSFVELVTNLNLESLLKLDGGRKTPKNIGDYRLVPITSTRTDFNSATSSGYDCFVPQGVKCNCLSDYLNTPYMDSSYAIGLVYRDVLSAISGARITPEAHIEVVQLQSVDARANAEGKERFKSGLHGGFLWRDTLVNAWAEIAQKLGVDVIEIQAAVNNRWLRIDKPDRTQRLIDGYDKVAERMRFTQNLKSKNWEARFK